MSMNVNFNAGMSPLPENSGVKPQGEQQKQDTGSIFGRNDRKEWINNYRQENNVSKREAKNAFNQEFERVDTSTKDKVRNVAKKALGGIGKALSFLGVGMSGAFIEIATGKENTQIYSEMAAEIDTKLNNTEQYVRRNDD